ncbi:MAG TPA: peptide-methionine (S)-S-oxide reductase MsrA [Spirochaetia bacterium]|nr:peptide-methionine (S)-S-oxide reductase MsrA [Spirochaetia bacterium]
MKPRESKTSGFAVFGGGCFWCMEAVYLKLPGIKSVVSGYAGGSVADPSYEEVCTGRTGHAEVVMVEYDPSQMSYEDVLGYFWKSHDPTTLNRQGPDSGTQYRSIILYANEEQRARAEASKREAQDSGRFSHDIVTQIVELQEFYPAEEYHQNYFARHPDVAYCRLVIQPKMEKLSKDLPFVKL